MRLKRVLTALPCVRKMPCLGGQINGVECESASVKTQCPRRVTMRRCSKV